MFGHPVKVHVLRRAKKCKTNVDGQTDKNLTNEDRITPILKAPRYDGDLSPCLV